MSSIIEVRNLTKVFVTEEKKLFTALDEVSFSLEKGECLGIVGESGSGKSTLVKMITRLMEPTKGSITFMGEDIAHLSEKRLRQVYQKMQMVFQMPQESFDPKRTLGNGIVESLRNKGMLRGERQRLLKQLLESCGLNESLANRYPYEVSGGQCQRAAIARALAVSPELLIFDEPTSALDVTVQKQILTLLLELRKKRELSMLFITHDLAVVQQICDHILILEQGRIVEQGKTWEVINHPQTIYTKRLIDSVL